MANPSAEDLAKEYTSSLADLTFNSKPLINVLTMLADENLPNANVIVDAIETHLSKVSADVKLPILYLIDCIVKNVGRDYTPLFSKNIVATFCNVFKVVDEKTRAEMFKLRQTWNEVFPQNKLYAIDVQIRMLDPAWPVTAQPANSIHLNPKFLKTNAMKATTAKSKPITETVSSVPKAAPSSDIDKETLLMQEQLIKKQKELLELQRKTLELEVLQTKVKLQEQMKSGGPPNILMNPEMAKNLIPEVMSKKPAGIASAVLNQRMQTNPSAPIKINPVRPGLAQAKPIRDPRLRRQQQDKPEPAQNPVSSQVSRDVSQPNVKPKSANNENSNKNMNSKLGVRETSNKDPRLSRKPDKPPKAPKISSIKPTPHPPVLSDPRNSPKLSPKSQVVDMEIENDDVNSSKLSSLSGSSLMLSSLSGSSPRLGTNSSSTTSLLSSPDRGNKTEKSKLLKSSPSKDASTKGGRISPPSDNMTFKRKSRKNRNYMRHNRDRSVSPDDGIPQDEDLRSLAPPDKQPRIDVDIVKQKTSEPVIIEASNNNMDVDLRQLPAVIGKKRPSTEGPDSTSKKSKTFDILFGNEDTDLRQLPVITPVISAPEKSVEKQLPAASKPKERRPKTPPPPIISDGKDKDKKSEPKDVKKNNFEAVRAKLANATANRDRVLARSYNKKKLQAAQDQDLRVSSTKPAILISPEDEKNIQSGTLTKEQQQLLMNKIFMQIEKNKLLEAKKKDHEDTLNASLQPISDDDFDIEETPIKSKNKGPMFERRKKEKQEIVSSPKRDRDERKVTFHKVVENPAGNASPQAQFNDKDERVNLPSHNIHPAGLPSSDTLSIRSDIPHRNIGNFPRNSSSHNIEHSQNVPSFYPRGDIKQRPPFRGSLSGQQWRGRGRGRSAVDIPPQRPMRPWMQNQQQSNWRNQGPRGYLPPVQDYPNQFADEDSMPAESEELVTIMEDIKTINIDNIPREIRTYGDTAIIFMNWDDPREISFQSGSRRVTFNNNEAYILNFGDAYKECFVNDMKYLVKLGVPTREIFINEMGYECFFGGAPITVTCDDNVSLTVQLDGPNPHVKISDQKRIDLVLGKVNLILNAKSVVPVFLDAKVQKFVINGEVVTLKFVDALKTCLINDVPFKVEFGGLPKPFFIHGTKHFIRFSVLPKGVRPGHVKIRDIDTEGTLSPRPEEDTSQEVPPSEAAQSNDSNGAFTGQESPDNRSKSPSFFQNLMQPSLNTFDVISNALATSMTPSKPTASAGNYEVENVPTTNATETKAPVLPLPVNINDLFQKLVASGFVKSNTDAAPAPAVINETVAPISTDGRSRPIINKPPVLKNDNIFNQDGRRTIFKRLKPIDFKRPETLKVRQLGLYLSLYSGPQCSSCGMRFSPEATSFYSQHLDWHFRQNRKGKNKVRVASSRKWYYSLADWKNYEEIEDLAEREKNYFDQQQAAEVQAEDGEGETEVPSVPADPSSTSEHCVVCKDAFEQFFNEEKEEWHLNNAIKVDGKNYHPVCYDDFQQSILESSLDESKPPENKLIPGLEIILDDDDDEYEPRSPTDVVSLPSESEDTSIIEELIENEEDEERREPTPEDDGDDDDVILNEVAPIKIVVDDDDDDEDISRESKSDKIKKEKKFDVEDDGFMDVEEVVSLTKGEHIKIKAEPVDRDVSTDQIQVATEPESSQEVKDDEVKEGADTAAAHPELITSIDGNIELTHDVPVSVPTNIISGNRIKINISKPLTVISHKETTTITDSSEHVENISVVPDVVPYKEPEVVHLKPSLQNLNLKKLPPVRKGTELTGLCSIM